MKKNIVLYLFIAPAGILSIAFFLLPVLGNFAISLSEWSVIRNSGRFVGLENFRAIFDDALFRESIFTTSAYTLITVPLLLVFGLLMALLVDSSPRRSGLFFQTVFFLPWVVPWLTAGLIWKYLYNDVYGLIDYFLVKWRIVQEPILFMNDKWTAILAVIGVCVWKTAGYNMVILLAGLKAIPDQVYEAAGIDGAGAFQRLFRITIPLLMPSISLMVIMAITGSYLAFDHFWVVTRGAPAHSTETILTWLYQTSFFKFELGQGSAMSIVLLGITGVFAYLQVRLFNVLRIESGK